MACVQTEGFLSSNSRPCSFSYRLVSYSGQSFGARATGLRRLLSSNGSSKVQYRPATLGTMARVRFAKSLGGTTMTERARPKTIIATVQGAAAQPLTMQSFGRLCPPIQATNGPTTLPRAVVELWQQRITTAVAGSPPV